MKKVCDLHNHSIFSDGNNTMEEMVIAAIEAGYDVFGISDHAHTSFDETYCMMPGQYRSYLDTIRQLQDKYRDRIMILAGIEMDYYTDIIPHPLDYVIGSVHYVLKEGHYLTIDANASEFQQNTEQFYSGDYYAFARDYYATVGGVVEKTNCDIIGHFDLFAKFNEGNRFFDETSDIYRSIWQPALEKLLQTGRCFEINYGAVNKGYRSIPYLRPEMQQFIREHGGRMIANSDSHSVNHHLPRELLK